MKIHIPYYLNKILITVFLGAAMFHAMAQQSPQYSQFMYNNLVINPAYAGAEEALSLTVLNRNQWSGVDKAPSTQSFSIHSLIKKQNIGLGLTIIRDQIGVHKTTGVLSNYAYHIRLKRQAVLSMGLQVGVTNLLSDYASLTGSGNDPKLANSINETMFDFGAGIYYRSARFHFGLSAPELVARTIHLNDTVSISLRRANLLVYSRYRFTLSQSFDFEPGVMVKYFPDLPLSFDINVNFIYRKVLTAGLSYRRNESLDMILKFQVTRQLQFGYAYDYPIQYVSKLSSASHELMVHYLFRNVKKQVVSPR